MSGGLKICGLQPGDDLRFATDPVVTHAGIVFVPRSRRYVPPERAARLTEPLRAHCTVLGVFVDSPLDEVLETAQTAGLTGVQLHGQETPEFCDALRTAGLTVWKALSVPRATPEKLAFVRSIDAFRSAVDAVLLDAPPPVDADAKVTGGHGRTFHWGDLPELLAHLRQPALPVWVAGGVTPENVSQLLDTFPAVGVDVSSGVETQGRKSPEKIQAMIEAVSRYAK